MRWALGLAWLAAGVVVAGFFLPWAHLEVREPALPKELGRLTVSLRQGTRTIGAALDSLQQLPRQVSGAQIPQLAGREDAQVAMTLMELVTRKRQHLGVKSYAVYLVPGLALLCALALARLGRRRAVAAGVGVLCLGVASLGGWKLVTTQTETLLVTITAGSGIWLSLWAYVGLSVAAGWCAVSSRRRTA